MIGGFAGAILASASYKRPPYCTGWECLGNALYPSQGEEAVAGAAVGAVGGMLIGGILGATVIHRSSYHEVKPTALGALASALTGEGDVALVPAFDPRTRTGGISLSVKF